MYTRRRTRKHVSRYVSPPSTQRAVRRHWLPLRPDYSSPRPHEHRIRADQAWTQWATTHMHDLRAPSLSLRASHNARETCVSRDALANADARRAGSGEPRTDRGRGREDTNDGAAAYEHRQPPERSGRARASVRATRNQTSRTLRTSCRGILHV
ncbi:hypothetical protein K466DRAFT_253656 [Polyporus arcularius HHB13444]|uniref:Uncharacterized protein n=1 Tax=Polyporus arcularius HHB13444 TaxID=1314778 RepID=A0A5C3P5X6_9APHY|nr:hypothetical protein K466DRAFT_253656 [Polyporus arcularius HHB13444]